SPPPSHAFRRGRSSCLRRNPRKPTSWRSSLVLRPVCRIALDRDELRSNRPEFMNAIDSKEIERDAGGKPLHTFPHPALDVELEQQHVAILHDIVLAFVARLAGFLGAGLAAEGDIV